MKCTICNIYPAVHETPEYVQSTTIYYVNNHSENLFKKK